MSPAPFRCDVLTLFAPLCEPYLRGSILGRALKQGLIDVAFTDFRDFTADPHRTVDDAPFGGGAGMVMLPEPLALAVEHVRATRAPARVVLLSPSGRVFNQKIAHEYAALGSIALICGRYEGVDERVAEHVVDEELSLGDFVLTGGELAALAVIDAVARLLPGVLGNAAGPAQESFTDLPLLEYPQYTRPQIWRGHAVPEVLLSGHHARIDAWRARQREERTQRRRPNLWRRFLAARDEPALTVVPVAGASGDGDR
jgi:tRNA (guanine37-N1)-methyltransferase